MISIEQNAIIKIFSVAAVIFLPPTLVASIYGMNFDVMPELHWAFGYPIAILLMMHRRSAPTGSSRLAAGYDPLRDSDRRLVVKGERFPLVLLLSNIMPNFCHAGARDFCGIPDRARPARGSGRPLENAPARALAR